MNPRRLAVLVSGTGRTLANLLAEIDAGRLSAEVGLVLSDRRGTGGSELAAERGLATRVVRPRDCPDAQAFSARVFEAIEGARCGTVVLAGFLRFLPIPERWLGHVLNIHPSLLPRHGGRGCYGNRVHAQVLAAGDSATGCTVHYVDNVYDHGPVILQGRLAVAPDDDLSSLAARVFEEECRVLPAALRQHLDGEVRFEDGRAVRSDGREPRE